MLIHNRTFALVIAASLGLLACRSGADTTADPAPSEQSQGERQARARMMSAAGEHLGEITFTRTAQGVRVQGQVAGLEGNGARGFHVHEFGQCDPPDFQSAGGHFNPHGHPHGGPDHQPGARHVGDFGNIEVDDEGNAQPDFIDPIIALEAGLNNIIGHALIIHAEEDDLQTQPTGDAGARAACGIIELVE
ncbi:MAG: superoxide dismutase family protein [Bradymonadaceae bacterium]|nr:superoxide dismutase family protein [Lujinxingiaceae bacterium]